MATSVDGRDNAFLFTMTEGAGKPVESFEVIFQKRLQVSRIGLEIDVVTPEYKKNTAMLCRDDAALAVVEEVTEFIG